MHRRHRRRPRPAYPAGSDEPHRLHAAALASVKEGNWVGGPNAAIVPLLDARTDRRGQELLLEGAAEAVRQQRGLHRAARRLHRKRHQLHRPRPDQRLDIRSRQRQRHLQRHLQPLPADEPVEHQPDQPRPREADTTELRFVGSRGTIITNPDGSYGMFLSGAWASDGDSDAFNQIFYTSSTNGKEWSVPKVVLSTDYTFSASAAQDEALGERHRCTARRQRLLLRPRVRARRRAEPGRHADDGVLRLPAAETDRQGGDRARHQPAARYTVGAKDPALYRNILTRAPDLHHAPRGSRRRRPSAPPTTAKACVGEPVTYTATVAPVRAGHRHADRHRRPSPTATGRSPGARASR